MPNVGFSFDVRHVIKKGDMFIDGSETLNYFFTRASCACLNKENVYLKIMWMKLTGVKRDVKKELFCCAVNRLDDFFFMSYYEAKYKSRLIMVYPCSAQHIAPDVAAGFYTVD